MQNRKRNRGWVALITGASSGIGRALALEIAGYSEAVVLIGRDRSRLEATRVAVQQRCATGAAFSCDFSKLEQVEKLAEQLNSRLSQLDVIVHAAGIMKWASIDDAEVGDIELQMRVNVVAPYILSKRLLLLLRRSKGQVVFINSTIVHHPSAGTIQYAATKHALKGVADGLRKELSRDGVRVISVFPGRTATPLQEWLHGLEGKAYHPERLLQPEHVADQIVDALLASENAENTEIHLRTATSHST